MALSDTRKSWHSFTGGEITEELFGRVNLQEYDSALATCQNFVVLPHGPVQSRAGFQFIRATKSNGAARLIPFVRGDGSSIVIELGNLYIRFHKDDATIEDPMSPGNPYEVVSPYDTDDIWNIKFEQSVDTITLCCPGLRHRELIRNADDDWDLDQIVHESPIDPPASAPTATPTGASGNTITYKYVVTSVDAYGNESIASDYGSCTNDMEVSGQYNTVTWSNVTGAAYFNVYREWAGSGRYYFIASTTSYTNGIVDDNIIPDFTKAPPEGSDPFGADGETTVPTVSSYYEQRRIFAATVGDPQRFWLTKSGSMYNMNVSVVPQDDDPFNFVLASSKAHTIRHIIPSENLIMVTGSAIWRLFPDSGGVLTPTGTVGKVTVEIGGSETRPVRFRERIMFANAKGEHLISIAFSTEAGGYTADDLSLIAAHLVDGYTWVQMDFTEAPYPIWWGVRSDGLLIGMTYSPKQNVVAWHKHQLGGTGVVVESVCAVPSNEGTHDVLYAVVKRTINGGTKRYVEFMQNRAFSNLTNSYCSDSCLKYSGAPATTITGLSHLEGESVVYLADGVAGTATVASGQITLSTPASVVIVGLGYNCDLKTLPLAYQSAALGMEQQENISGVRLRVKDTLGMSAGPSFTELQNFETPVGESSGVLRSGIIDLGPAHHKWSEDSQVCIRQSQPYPVTITAIAVSRADGN